MYFLIKFLTLLHILGADFKNLTVYFPDTIFDKFVGIELM